MLISTAPPHHRTTCYTGTTCTAQATALDMHHATAPPPAHHRTIDLISHLNSSAPWLNAGMRLAEVAIGAMVGVIGGFLLRNFPVSEE